MRQPHAQILDRHIVEPNYTPQPQHVQTFLDIRCIRFERIITQREIGSQKSEE